MPRARPLIAVAAFALLATGPAPAGAAAPPPAAVGLRDTAPPYRWARPIAAALVRSGRWASLARVDLGAPAPRRALLRAVALATGATPPPPGTGGGGPVSAYAAHRAFVSALGLGAEAAGIARLATADGAAFRMPAYAGSEVLARELGMVHNYPSRHEAHERSGREPVRWADLLGMLDAARRLDPGERARLAAYRIIALPSMTPAQRAVAQAALSRIGSPYVWGGDWPTSRSPWGWQAHGGFDCSGLVWWAFKANRRSAALGLGTGLWNRTADGMAWERRAERVPLRSASPGDLLFYGDAGPRVRRGEISHMGIALGNGWMVQAAGSRGGVSITRLDDYWTSGAAFGRRVRALRT